MSLRHPDLGEPTSAARAVLCSVLMAVGDGGKVDQFHLGGQPSELRL